jgi:large conductance mechanosensitive channel
MLKEFKAFVMRGNVLDLAVGVIIGGAFGKIVASLVTDILTPIIGLVIGGVDFSGMVFTFRNATITYGVFLNNVIDFLVIAFVIFMIIKAANAAKKPTPAEDPVTKECPYCFSTIPIKATRCPNCTSEIK